ncbi:ComEA family DNA-binding protein [Pasteurella langaaensis]|uniref:ComEA family DNA-binding protein n=1 Tax=Alitibacter langaaensis TaxID=756 RepID=UPI001A9C79F8|nr:helix-hairpin-helix domain-containing protein [Pasteurella langaaensis]
MAEQSTVAKQNTAQEQNVVAEQSTAAEQNTLQQQKIAENSQPLPANDKVNINNADAAEIQSKLIGIGAKKAEAIVQYREKHGNFTAVEQLLEVQGIGKATLEKNKDRLAF